MFFVLDPTLQPTATNGTFDVGSVSYIGCHIDTTASAKSQNLIIDSIMVGEGIRVTGTDTNGWLDAVDYCTDYTNRAWGFLDYDDTQSTIYVKGKIFIGDSTQTAVTSLTDSGRKIKFTYNLYYDRDGNWVPMVRDDQLGIVLEDDSTYATTFTDGVIVGSTAGRGGSSFDGDETVRVSVDFDAGDSNDASVVQLYGTRFNNMGNITFKDDANWDCFSTTFSQCWQVDFVGAVDAKNCIFSNTSDLYPRYVDAAISDDGGSQADDTTDATDIDTNDMELLPSSPATNDAYYFGLDEQFGGIRIDIGTAGSGNEIIWEYYNGSWTALSDVYDGTEDYEQAGTSDVRWTVPTDWTTTTVNSQGPYYYVRARCNTVGTQALGNEAWALKGGSAMLWNSLNDCDSSNFLGNIHDDLNVHAIQHDTATTVTYYDLLFSGNGYDVHFTPASGDLTVNKNGTSNPSTDDTEGSGSVSFVGTVNLKVTVKDPEGTVISGARVLLEAYTGGSDPYLASVTISQTGGTATVSHTGHGLSTGEMVNIRGANEPEYNGAGKVITYVSANSYTYSVDAGASSPATGTITATQCYISETTDGSGIAEESYKYGSTQPAQLRVVKSDGSPVYYTDVTQTVPDVSGGLNLPVQMGIDE